MKIIDEKGRVFGKINVIDFLVILLLLLLVPTFNFSKRLLIKEKPVIDKKAAIIQVKFSNVMPEIDRVLKVGDINIDGRTGKLKAILKNRPADINSLNREIVALFDITCEESDGTLFYKDTPVRIGAPFSFTTDLYSVGGVIIGAGTGEIPHKRNHATEVEVRFSNVAPELAAALKIGDTGLNDMATGKLKAILSDKTTGVLELKLASLGQNEPAIFADPLNRDIVALFEIACEENHGTLFYNDTPVRIGAHFSFTTALYNISGVVIGVKK